MAQNVSGATLGDFRCGKGLTKLRIDIGIQRPTFVILSETRYAEMDKVFHNTYKGYSNYQNSSSGEHAKGILVFSRRGVTVIEGSVYNNEDGYFSTAVYEMEGHKIVVCGIYGPPDSSDAFAHGIYSSLFDKLTETMQLYGTQSIILAGDWNLHLDRQDIKPRTCKLVRDYAGELGLIDCGHDEKKFTWTRPGRRRAKSRIDYVMLSDNTSDF
jgi:exonuclease III